ncbi:diguanylate cyclase [Azospirillaceae bacterium]
MVKVLNVLLIEDSESDAELLLRALSREGFTPIHKRVETAPAMRAALADKKWDVILCDYNMPRFHPEAALGLLHESQIDIPFIILSGVVRAEDVVFLLKRGAHDFLNKDSLARLGPAIERELREAEVRRQRSIAEERIKILSLTIEQSPVSVAVANRNGDIIYVNPKFEDVSGYNLEEVQGRNLNFQRSDQVTDQMISSLWITISSGREWRGEFCNRRKNGQLFWEYVTIAPLKTDNGKISHFIIVKEDITVRRQYEERLLRQANYDDITNLPNRVLMQDRLSQSIVFAHRQSLSTALLYIDLDRFKNVNDVFGHAVGDILLRAAAERLSQCVHEGDTVARIGGDEFAVILPGVNSGRAAEKVAQRILDAFTLPFQINSQDIFVTASIGISLSPTDGDNQQILLRNADLAMDQAKEKGRNHYKFFTKEINEKVQERIGIENSLRGAVSRNELLLYYQPIIDVSTQKPVAIEALVRWRRPDGTILLPDQFIPIAEDAGLILSVGEWVLATACAQARELEAFVSPPLRIAVNVSPRQIRAGNFGDTVEHILEQTGLPPDRLELEITEGVLIDGTPECTHTLNKLCSLGVRLSIDDFGTGYSSLGYLQRYPFDTLKIDRSFICDVVENANSTRLVETIIAMAHNMDMSVIAEGVETVHQLNLIRDRACDFAQGYYISHPISFEKMLEFMKRALS